MVAKTRNLTGWMIDKKFNCKHKQLLVSGCSFTYNNSDTGICTWPYFLESYLGLYQVYDCSQSGAGSNHIFNSVVNEIETNDLISYENTLVIVMWSGLTRTDVIAENELTKDWHSMSNYKFDDIFSTLSIFNDPGSNKTPLDDLCRQYKKLISFESQVYESLLKVIALKNYLENMGFDYVFVNWADQTDDLNLVQSKLVDKYRDSIANIETLNEYAVRVEMQEDDGHPTPRAHLEWTEEILIPYLKNQNLIREI